MFRNKKRLWYLQTVAILFTIRIMYGFARFFLKAADRQSRPAKQVKNISRKKYPR